MLTRRSLLAIGAASLATRVPALAKFGKVEIGVCGGAANFSKAEQAGFDYYEPSAAALAAMSEADFEAFKKIVLASRIRCRSVNSLIRTLKVVGPEAQPAAVDAYLNSTLDRCAALGVNVAVWGSASSRNVPEGFSRAEAGKQIVAFLRSAGEIAHARGITIAIEPLQKSESNIINSGAEALELVRAAAHPQVKMIIDYYHLRRENEDPQIVVKARDAIVHFHFANPNGRLWPKQPDEDPVYPRFFELVKQTGFAGGLSIEGTGTVERDGRASLDFFRRELA